MQFTIAQTQLQKAVGVVSKSIPSRPQLPVLGSILLSVTNNILTLSATDLYVGVTVTLAVSESQDGSIALPAKQFKQLISTSPKEDITIQATDTACSVSSSHSKAELAGVVGEEFPSFPTINQNKQYLEVQEIQKIAKWVLPSASSDPTRPILTTVLVQLSEKKLEAVCTDGFRLALLELSRSQTPAKIESILLPARALKDIAKITEEEKATQIELMVDVEQKQSVISVGDYTYYLRIIDGEYPPYKKILPDQQGVLAEFDRTELIENLQRAMVFNQDNSYIASFVFDEGAVWVKASSPSVGSFEAELVSAKVLSSTKTSIAFNTRYILDLLQEAQDDTIAFGMSDSLKPAWFKIPSEPTFLLVVMPFRLNS